MAGKLLNLWKLFGHFEPAPKNLTDKETKAGQAGASVLDSISWYHDNLKASSDYTVHMGELKEMADFEFIGPIIDLYAEEATQPDLEKGKTVWYECDDSDIERNLNDMLDRVNNEELAYTLAFDISGFGNAWLRILRNDDDGITQLVPMVPGEVERVWEPTTRRLVGFKWKDQEPANDDSAVFAGQDKIFAPWEFLHFRRMGRSRKTEYGEALVEALFPLYRKVKMGVDQMLIYRLHTMPNRFAVYVDTGTQPVSESMETTNMFKNHFRSSLAAGKQEFEAR